MKNKIKTYLLSHKKISVIILLVCIYVIYKIVVSIIDVSGETKYVLGAPEIQTIVSSISGTGQVSASNQIELNAKSSGVIVSLPVKSGDMVKAGTLIAAIDSRNARISLENAQIALQKLKSTNTLTLAQAENSLASAQSDVQKEMLNITMSYDDLFTELSDTFVDLPDIMTKSKEMLYGSTGYLSDYKGYARLSDRSRLYRDQAGQKYDQSRRLYESQLTTYKSLSRSSATSTITSFANEVYVMTKLVADSIKDARNAVDYIKDTQSQSVDVAETLSAQSNLSNWSATVSSHVQDLYTAIRTITTTETALSSAQRVLNERLLSLKEIQQGADPLDIRSQELAVQQRYNEYQDYFVKAPFDGVIGKLNLKKGDTANGSIGTFITNQKIATISLNEVDIAKIKIGQKATLSFDAIEDFTVAGQVMEVDLVGTINQGVVSYNVKIGFDSEDARIKSGMSVSANVIIESRQDVLTIPNSAIKTRNGVSYVEKFKTIIEQPDVAGVMVPETPEQVRIETGLSDDTNTEIINGLTEQDQIIIRTVLPKNTSSSASTPSLFGGSSNRSLGGTRNLTR